MTCPLGTCSSASQTLIWNGAPIRCSRVSPPPKAAVDPGRQPLRRLDEVRLRPARAQVGHRRLAPGLGGEGEAAEPAVGAHGERRAEGRVEPAPGDLEPLAAAGVLARAHRLPAQEEVVQPPRPGEAGGVGGVEHAVPLGEQPLGVVERQVLLVALRADADPLAEDALEVRRAQADARRDVLERGLLAATARRYGRWRGRSPRSGRVPDGSVMAARCLALTPKVAHPAAAPHPNPAETALRGLHGAA